MTVYVDTQDHKFPNVLIPEPVSVIVITNMYSKFVRKLV